MLVRPASIQRLTRCLAFGGPFDSDTRKVRDSEMRWLRHRRGTGKGPYRSLKCVCRVTFRQLP